MPRSNASSRRSSTRGRGATASRSKVTGRNTPPPTLFPSSASLNPSSPSPGSTPPPTPTTTPAIIGSPATSQITPTSAAVQVSLDQPCQLYIQYGTTTGYGSETARETSFDYSTHVQSITGLAANTLYHYRIIATNASGQVLTSGDYTFTTASSGADTAGRRSTPAALSALVYPTTDEGQAVSWRPTSGHIHAVTAGMTEAQAKAVLDSATDGTLANPCIVTFAPGTYTWTTRYLFQAPRQYIIVWGYGATINSTQTATRTHFQLDGTSSNPLNHHIKILGFELAGTHTNAGTTSAYGVDNAICVALYGQVEDIELADLWIHNVWSDGIYIHGDSQSWVRAKRVSIHHNLVDKCGRQNLTLDQCEDLWVIWNVISNAAMYLIDVEDARHVNQAMTNFFIRDNTFDSWCWDKHAFGASYFNQNAVAFVNNRSVPNFTAVASAMSASGIYIERNTFLGGPKGWGSDPAVVYQGETGINNKFNEAICFGPAAWSSVGANCTIPKTGIYIRNNDFTGVPSGIRGRGAISVTYGTTVVITGNNCPGYNIYSVGNTGATLSGNTAAAEKTSWP